MSEIINKIRSQAISHPEYDAIQSDTSLLSYSQLVNEIDNFGKKVDGQCVGIFLENSPAWAIADLALLDVEKTCVPLPLFFSDTQLAHIIRDAGIQQIVTDDIDRLKKFNISLTSKTIKVDGKQLHLATLAEPTILKSPAIRKITYTSGSTGSPKGVCLSELNIDNVTSTLSMAAKAKESDNSLALLPLSTLLENIGSVYVPLVSGGKTTLIPGNLLGIHGSSSISVPLLLENIAQFRPTSLILTPQLLNLLVTAHEVNNCLPESLRFIAVGGAVVSKALLDKSSRLGLPVYQGYGLSEAASVVALNTENNNRIGSVGKALPHLSIRVDDHGEIHIHGNLFMGYLHQQQSIARAEWATGDLGYIDADGYLYVTGRKRNVFITLNGRNVSPEWVETELTNHPNILQAAFFGESRPFNVAILVCAPAVTPDEIREIVSNTNSSLPDYAQVHEYICTESPFSVNANELNAAGVMDRKQIFKNFSKEIDGIYSERKAI